MTNRTIQFLGNGYAPSGTEPITISATLNGNVVYTGTIPTSYTSEINHLPDNQEVLFTCELPVDFSGTLPMSISLDNPVGVTVFFEQIQSNYMETYNPVYTPEQLTVLTNPSSTLSEKIAIYEVCAVPPLSPAEIAILETGAQRDILINHNLTLRVSSGPSVFLSASAAGDARSNVVVNGTARTRGSSPSGTWGWIVEFPAEGSGLFECDVTVLAGLE